MLHLSENKFLCCTVTLQPRVDHSKLAAINKQPPLLLAYWQFFSWNHKSEWVGSMFSKHQSMNGMIVPCRGMWQGTSIWRQHTTRITCSALWMDGQGDLVHVRLFATVDKTGASEAYAKLLSFICTWWDMEKDFARVLLPSRVGGMCVWVAACRTKIDNWREKERDYKRRHERRDMEAHG